MPTYVFYPPDQTKEYDPQQITDYLQAQGITASGVRVRRDPGNPDTVPFCYVIDSDLDPTAALSGVITPSMTPEQKAIAYLRGVLPQFRDEVQPVTTLQLRRAIVALAVLVRGGLG